MLKPNAGRGMRTILIVFLASLLIVRSADAQEPTGNSAVKQSIASMPAGSHVELQLLDGKKERGRIVSRSGNGFALKPDAGAGEQSIAYDNVRSVSRLKHGHSKAKWVVIGVVAGAVVAAAAAALAVKNHGPVLNGSGRL
jgi:hypothetical protein